MRDERIIEKDILPAFGKRKASLLKCRDIITLLDRVLDEGELRRFWMKLDGAPMSQKIDLILEVEIKRGNAAGIAVARRMIEMRLPPSVE